MAIIKRSEGKIDAVFATKKEAKEFKKAKEELEAKEEEKKSEKKESDN